jgi:DNA-binding GntR family transcriptional regulator
MGVETSEHATRTDAAYEAIRTAIITWDLAPGAHITEGMLSERTGYGRAPVRAALTRLVHEHLVTAIPRRGYEVAPITFRDVTDVFGVRAIIEPAAARIVATRGDLSVADELAAINERCRYVPDPYDAVALRCANRDFHVAIARATGNERLATITSAALDDMQRILYLPQVARETDRVASTWEEHERIVDAIRHRDPHTAEAAAAAHVDLNKVMLVDLLIRSAEIGSINLFHS